MKILTDFGWAILGLVIFVALAYVDHYRRKYWQRKNNEEANN